MTHSATAADVAAESTIARADLAGALRPPHAAPARAALAQPALQPLSSSLYAILSSRYDVGWVA